MSNKNLRRKSLSPTPDSSGWLDTVLRSSRSFSFHQKKEGKRALGIRDIFWKILEFSFQQKKERELCESEPFFGKYYNFLSIRKKKEKGHMFLRKFLRWCSTSKNFLFPSAKRGKRASRIRVIGKYLNFCVCVQS